MKTAACVATLVILALFLTPSRVHANDTGITPDKKLAKELENLADLCYAMGIKAKDSGIYNFAKSFFNHALTYDPDHKETRKILGFKKKGKDWVADKADYGMPTNNTVNKSKEEEIFNKVWLETKDIREKAADKLYEFVADEKLESRQRLLALHHLMLIDPWHSKGHRAANLETPEAGTSNDLWMHAKDRDFYHQRASWTNGIPAPFTVTEKTPYEETLGLAFSKVRGERFFVHVRTDLNADQLAQGLTPFAEASFKKLHEYLALDAGEAPKEDAKRLHYTVFQQRADYAKFIDKCAGIEDAQRRKEIAEVGYGYVTRKPSGNVWLYSRPDNDAALRDGIAHEIGSYTIAQKCGYRLYWLNRGIGFTMSNRSMATVKANFAVVKGTAVIDSGGAESMPGLGSNAAGWRFKVLMALAGGKSMSLLELTKVSVNSFSELHGAFAFCYTEYLLERHKDKFAPFLKDAYDDTYERYKKKEQPETPEETLNRLIKHLAVSVETLQSDFALWAVENYLRLPKKG